MSMCGDYINTRNTNKTKIIISLIDLTLINMLTDLSVFIGHINYKELLRSFKKYTLFTLKDVHTVPYVTI